MLAPGLLPQGVKSEWTEEMRRIGEAENALFFGWADWVTKDIRLEAKDVLEGILVGSKALEDRDLSGITVIMSHITFNDFVTLNFEMGSEVSERVTPEGFKYYVHNGKTISPWLQPKFFTPTEGKPTRWIYVAASDVQYWNPQAVVRVYLNK
jgi:hypothetical protein